MWIFNFSTARSLGKFPSFNVMNLQLKIQHFYPRYPHTCKLYTPSLACYSAFRARVTWPFRLEANFVTRWNAIFIHLSPFYFPTTIQLKNVST